MPTSSLFVSANGPIGVAADTERLLFTQLTPAPPNGAVIFSVTDPLGQAVVTEFAPSFPNGGLSVERYIDINPGLGAWAAKAHYVYVTQGREIYEIHPSGAAWRLFAARPPDAADLSGITFDGEGTFNHDMIVTDNTGNVFRVDPAGTMTGVNLETAGQKIEGPAVVPAPFGPHGGEVWVAAEDAGQVLAVAADGAVNVITDQIPHAENIRVVPAAPLELGASGGAYFAADYPTRIIQYPASDFADIGGNVLVGQEAPPLPPPIGGGGGIMMISESGGTYNVTPFDPTAFAGQAEGAAFVGPGRTVLVYAVKFLCGRLPELDPNVEAPVEPGSYTTAINVHNPNHRPVVITKKAVLLYPGKPEDPRPPVQPQRPIEPLELPPDWGAEIDCQDIREVLLGSDPAIPPVPPGFIKGWVVLESPAPLDVEVVYTARGLQGGFSLTTERVHPTEVGPG